MRHELARAIAAAGKELIQARESEAYFLDFERSSDSGTKKALKVTILVRGDGGAPHEAVWDNRADDVATAFENVVTARSRIRMRLRVRS